MATTPAADVVDELAQVLLGTRLPLALRCWDGSSTSGPADAPTLVVHTPRAVRRFLWAPHELGLARAYVSGELDLEGDVYGALRLPEALHHRPDQRLDPRAVTHLLPALARLGALGPPPPPPPEEARLRGRLHSLRRDRAAISHHYDVGNDFYRLLLGSSMVYSCAYFDAPETTLEHAQEAKLELICRKLELCQGMRLLDVGCGWGSLALHAATRHGVDVVGVTLSTEQAAFARRLADDAGVADRVDIRVQDYRDVSDGPYDTIASVGMAEHVGGDQLDGYAQGLHDLLRPGGRLLNHAIARGLNASDNPSDPRTFIPRYVFPDGDLQPVARHVAMLESAGLEVVDVESLRRHYALTCRAWVANLERHWDEAVRTSSPGRARVWLLYLAGSALGFEGRRVGVNQVLATKPGSDREPLRRPDRTSGLPA